MKVVVVGAGAVGTLYGGWLIAGGGDVAFVARGQRLDELRSGGIEIVGDGPAIRLPPVEAAENVRDLPPADVLIYAVKLYDLEEAARGTRHALSEGGLAIGLQNGVDAAAILSAVFPHRQVMAGPVYSAATLGEGGAVRHAGARNDLVIGNVEGVRHPHADALVALWGKAGVVASVSNDIRATLWTKFLALATNAALTCLSRRSAGVIYHDPDLLALAERSIAEIAAVAAAEGVQLSPDAPATALALLRGFPPEVVASMRQDLDAGRRLELDGICGTIVRLGRKHGVPTPVHEVAYACLKPFKDGAPPPQREQD